MKKKRVSGALFYIFAVILPATIMFVALAGLRIVPFGDNTLIISDADGLYINFLSYVGRAVKGQEGFLFSFEKGLGGNMIGSWAWFLLNPLFGLFAFFDISAYPAAYTYVSVLNLSACGLTMYMLLKDMYGHKLSNLLFSTSYALNGFLVANVFQMNFFTGVFALPIMVLGLRRILNDQNPIVYILALAYSLLMNFYFGFMLCVASLLIFLAFYTADYQKLKNRKNIAVKYILSSLFAGALSSIIWLPALLSMRGGRLDQPMAYAISLSENMPFLDMAAKLFTGANSTAELRDGLPNVFVGILPIPLVLLFFLNKGIDKRRKIASFFLLITYLISFYIRVFNLFMHGGTVTNWFNYRDSFIFSFLLLLIAAEQWQHISDVPKEQIKRVAVYLLIAVIVVFSKRYEFVLGGEVLLDLFLLLLMYCAYRMHIKDPVKNPKRIFELVTLILVSVNLFLNYYLCTKNIQIWDEKKSDYEEIVIPVSALVDAVKESDDEFYRMEIGKQRSGNLGNDPMFYGYNGVGHGGSDDRDFVREALNKLGIHRYDMRNSYGKGITSATDSLLGLKYIISQENLSEEKGYENLVTIGDWTLYRNSDALPVAFLSEAGISEVETEFTDVFENLNHVWTAISGIEQVVFHEEEDISFVSHNITDPLRLTRLEGAEIVQKRDDATSKKESDKQLEEQVMSSASISNSIRSDELEEGSLKELPDSISGIEYTWVASQKGPVYSYNRSGLADKWGAILPAFIYDGYYHEGDTIKAYLPMENGFVTKYVLEDVAGRFRAAYADNDKLHELASVVKNRPCTIEKVKENHLHGEFTAEKGQKLVFTIPYDEGWTCYIDGEKAQIDIAIGAFMTIDVPQGSHSYEMFFMPTGLIPAGFISMIFLALLPIYILVDRRRPFVDISEQGGACNEEYHSDIANLKRFTRVDWLFIAGVALITSWVLLNGSTMFSSVVVLLVLEGLIGLWLLYHSGVIKDRSTWIVSVYLLVISFGFRALVFDYKTLDYINFLTPWLNVFQKYGGFQALRFPIGNYNIPYLYFLAMFSQLRMDNLYLIKLLSTFSDVLLAWSVLLICSRFTKNRFQLLFAFFATLLLPTVFLNSAVWGQCDSLYVAPLILGMYCAMSGRPWESVILAAIGFGFKLQAVFILPIYVVFLMTGHLRWRHCIAFPVTYLLLVIPAVCFGRPFWETITLYFNQTGSIGAGLNYNSSSIFALVGDIQNTQTASNLAIFFAFVYMIVVFVIAWVNRKRINDKAILAFSILFAIGIPLLLPHMHERYFYGADILSVILAVSFPSYFYVAILLQFASLLGYHAYLTKKYLLPMSYGTIALLGALISTSIYLRNVLRNNQIQMAPKDISDHGI